MYSPHSTTDHFLLKKKQKRFADFDFAENFDNVFPQTFSIFSDWIILYICTTYENYHCNIIKGNSSLRFLQPLKTRTSTKYLIQLTFFGIDTTKINSQKMLVRWNFSLRIYPFLSKQHFYKQRQAEIGKKSGKS